MSPGAFSSGTHGVTAEAVKQNADDKPEPCCVLVLPTQDRQRNCRGPCRVLESGSDAAGTFCSERASLFDIVMREGGCTAQCKALGWSCKVQQALP